MIVCSCICISDREIRAAVADLVEENPDCVLTPGLVYRKLGYRAECGTCLSLAIELIIDEIDHPSRSGCQVIHLFQQKEKLQLKREARITKVPASKASLIKIDQEDA